MSPPFRAKSGHHQVRVTSQLQHSQEIQPPVVEDSVSQITDWMSDMNYDEQMLDLDPATLLLGLGYAALLLTIIGWVATL